MNKIEKKTEMKESRSKCQFMTIYHRTNNNNNATYGCKIKKMDQNESDSFSLLLLLLFPTQFQEFNSHTST